MSNDEWLLLDFESSTCQKKRFSLKKNEIEEKDSSTASYSVNVSSFDISSYFQTRTASAKSSDAASYLLPFSFELQCRQQDKVKHFFEALNDENYLADDTRVDEQINELSKHQNWIRTKLSGKHQYTCFNRLFDLSSDKRSVEKLKKL